jgi:hypothetical protein
MASEIRIKRSGNTVVPTSLKPGELAYSWANGADKLYIGWGTDQNGNSTDIVSIGGKFFTDMLDHTAGTLTASSAIIVDSNSKIDQLLVDNLKLDANTLSSTDTNGNILISPDGTGYVQIVGTNGLVLPVGTTAQQGPAVTGAVRFNSTTSQYEGYNGTNWASLGGVRSVDGLTYITAESTPGASNDTISFYTADSATTTTLAATLTATSLDINLTTDSTSTSSGALIVDGGAGIAKNLYVGGDLRALGDTYLGDSTTDSLLVTGDVTVSLPDNTSIALDIKQGDDSYIKVVTTDDAEKVVFGTITDVNIASTTAATSTTTGALTVAGGVGIAGALYVAGAISAESATFDSINATPIGNVTPDTGAFTVLNVDNLQLDDSTLSSTNVNGDINITPNGTGKLVLANPYVGTDSLQEYIEDSVNSLVAAGEGIDVTYDDVNGTLTIDAEIATTTNRGVASFADADFNVTDGAVELKDTVVKGFTVDADAVVTPSGHSVKITGGEGIDVTVDGAVITVAGEDATTTNKGVASFDTANFTVTNGAVSTKDITLGTSTLTNGSTTLSLSGLQSLAVDNLTIDGNEISSSNANGNISLNPNGTGTVDVNGARITTLATPVDGTDAATKAYVDSVANGLDVKQSVRVATTSVLTATYSNGTNGEGATLTNAGSQAALVLDGVSVVQGDRVLVKDQTTALQNGIYVVTTVGSGSTNWVLTRATDFDNSPGTEVTAGVFTFVEEGTSLQDNGYVVTTNGPVVIGTTDIVWNQFSGAGQIDAGDALTKTGNRLDVVVAASGGIEISGDALQLKSSVAGAGLTYTSGVINVVGTTDRITVNADSIDIASTYVGQTSITTLGTITTGVWNGTTVTVPYGGTGVTSFTTNGIVYGNGSGALQVTAAGTWDSTHSVGQLLSVNSSGVPTWTNIIDGGTF